MVICAPENHVLLLFFFLQKQAKPQKTCPPSFLLKSKQNPNSSNKIQPSLLQTPSSSPEGSSHLRHVRCWALCCSLFLLITALATSTPMGRNYGHQTSQRTLPVVNKHVLLAHHGPWGEHLSPGSCEGGRGEWLCSPQLIEGASASKDWLGVLCGINPKAYARTGNIFPAFWLNKQMALPPKIAMSPMPFERGRNFLT